MRMIDNDNDNDNEGDDGVDLIVEVTYGPAVLEYRSRMPRRTGSP
ncbi:hypothetical protein [Amycolatopsis sp. WAC 01375]|nr:hypothetical protein [Amycolatopsis sp. WAC 01375]